MKKIALLSLLTFYVSFSPLHAGSSLHEKPILSIEKIMEEPSWIGNLPSDIRWAYNSKKVYFTRDTGRLDVSRLYQADFKSGMIRRVDSTELERLLPTQAVFNQGRDRAVYVQSGRLIYRDVTSGQEKTIVSTDLTISSPQFNFKEDKLVFLMNQNLWSWTISDGSLQQLTNFKSTVPATEASRNEEDNWLRNQQIELFDVIRERTHAREKIKNQSVQKDQLLPKEIYLGRGRLTYTQLSPSEKYITYLVSYSPQQVQNTRIPQYVTESGYTEVIPSNPKVGFSRGYTALFIFDREKEISYSLKTGMIPGIHQMPLYLSEYETDQVENEKDRDVLISGLFWSNDGEQAFVNIRSMDNKDRWILLVDLQNGQFKVLDRQRDETWIAGPGINVWGIRGSLGWMPDNKRVWFQSEETGYSHLYTVDIETGEKKALTSGPFEIFNPVISRDRKWWYFTSNEVHPGERHFYRMSLDGGLRTQITQMTGHHEVSLSPDEKYLAIRYSYSNLPWELYFMENKPGATIRKITNSLSEEFLAYPWRDPYVITFPSSDGADVFARIYHPDENKKNHAAVIFVHGAGYLQNAHKWWSRYSREYMFHNLLTDLGYTVLDIDYRGSAGYGRDWRTGIYRYMGGKDLHDHVDGARFLAEQFDIDSSRIGIYGGSYGGFITLMALFKYPDVFASGAAMRAVTDWAHYNHSYTSNILNTPLTDPEAFRRSSPIYFAEGLQGHLLMTHGMVDDNVHFQDIVRLSQRLIELGKDNWELAIYPVERHAFTEPSSWVDQYKRILKLFESTLR